MDNPIIDNRIVSDMTFAVRLNHFLKNTQVNDMMSEEEKEYLTRVTKRLIEYQKATATQVGEIDYLKRAADWENEIENMED